MMKKAIIGGFLTLAGVIGSSLMLVLTGLHPASEWTTPPGRVLTTMMENGTLLPAILFFVLLVIGLYILTGEFLSKK